MRHQRARRTAARQRSARLRHDQGRTKHARGRENEIRVGQALEILKEEGYIVSYFISTPNGELDRQGVDAGMKTARGVEHTFQIKSSLRRVQEHMLKHPEIPCLNVHGYVFAKEVALLIRMQFKLFSPTPCP
jgi:hypothetical protein